MATIDLERLTGDGKVHNLSGRERGLAARRMYHLDEIEKSDEPVDVIVPEYIYSLTPSFFQGFFGETVRARGYDAASFKRRFRFKAPDIVLQQLDRGLAAILTNRDFGLL